MRWNTPKQDTSGTRSVYQRYLTVRFLEKRCNAHILPEVHISIFVRTQYQLDVVRWLEPHFHAPGPPPSEDGGVVDTSYDEERLFPAALSLAMSRPHVMSCTRERLVESVCSLLERGVGLVLEYNEGHPDFPLPTVGA